MRKINLIPMAGEGKRFLKEQLINPLIDSDDINKRYELVEFLCNNNYCYYCECIYEYCLCQG